MVPINIARSLSQIIYLSIPDLLDYTIYDFNLRNKANLHIISSAHLHIKEYLSIYLSIYRCRGFPYMLCDETNEMIIIVLFY